MSNESNEIFNGQYNDAYKEIVIDLKVTINTVQLKKVDIEVVRTWFEKHIAALETGLQINYGNSMHRITVTKLDEAVV